MIFLFTKWQKYCDVYQSIQRLMFISIFFIYFQLLTCGENANEEENLNEKNILLKKDEMQQGSVIKSVEKSIDKKKCGEEKKSNAPFESDEEKKISDKIFLECVGKHFSIKKLKMVIDNKKGQEARKRGKGREVHKFCVPRNITFFTTTNTFNDTKLKLKILELEQRFINKKFEKNKMLFPEVPKMKLEINEWTDSIHYTPLNSRFYQNNSLDIIIDSNNNSNFSGNTRDNSNSDFLFIFINDLGKGLLAFKDNLDSHNQINVKKNYKDENKYDIEKTFEFFFIKELLKDFKCKRMSGDDLSFIKKIRWYRNVDFLYKISAKIIDIKYICENEILNMHKNDYLLYDLLLLVFSYKKIKEKDINKKIDRIIRNFDDQYTDRVILKIKINEKYKGNSFNVRIPTDLYEEFFLKIIKEKTIKEFEFLFHDVKIIRIKSRLRFVIEKILYNTLNDDYVITINDVLIGNMKKNSNDKLDEVLKNISSDDVLNNEKSYNLNSNTKKENLSDSKVNDNLDVSTSNSSTINSTDFLKVNDSVDNTKKNLKANRTVSIIDSNDTSDKLNTSSTNPLNDINPVNISNSNNNVIVNKNDNKDAVQIAQIDTSNKINSFNYITETLSNINDKENDERYVILNLNNLNCLSEIHKTQLKEFIFQSSATANENDCLLIDQAIKKGSLENKNFLESFKKKQKYPKSKCIILTNDSEDILEKEIIDHSTCYVTKETYKDTISNIKLEVESCGDLIIERKIVNDSGYEELLNLSIETRNYLTINFNYMLKRNDKILKITKNFELDFCQYSTNILPITKSYYYVGPLTSQPNHMANEVPLNTPIHNESIIIDELVKNKALYNDILEIYDTEEGILEAFYKERCKEYLQEYDKKLENLPKNLTSELKQAKSDLNDIEEEYKFLNNTNVETHDIEKFIDNFKDGMGIFNDYQKLKENNYYTDLISSNIFYNNNIQKLAEDHIDKILQLKTSIIDKIRKKFEDENDFKRKKSLNNPETVKFPDIDVNLNDELIVYEEAINKLLLHSDSQDKSIDYIGNIIKIFSFCRKGLILSETKIKIDDVSANKFFFLSKSYTEIFPIENLCTYANYFRKIESMYKIFTATNIQPRLFKCSINREGETITRKEKLRKNNKGPFEFNSFDSSKTTFDINIEIPNIEFHDIYQMELKRYSFLEENASLYNEELENPNFGIFSIQKISDNETCYLSIRKCFSIQNSIELLVKDIKIKIDNFFGAEINHFGSDMAILTKDKENLYNEINEFQKILEKRAKGSNETLMPQKEESNSKKERDYAGFKEKILGYYDERLVNSYSQFENYEITEWYEKIYIFLEKTFEECENQEYILVNYFYRKEE